MLKGFFRNYKTFIYFVLFLVVIGLFGLKSSLFSFSSSTPKDEIKIVVREFIEENPDVIVNSVMKLQERKVQEMQQKTQELVKESKSSLESTENQPFFGSKDAKFVVVQFFDYRCGHCKSSNKDITRFITENPDAKVVYSNLAILGPDSVKASQASLAVYKLYPEAFKGFHDSLMAAPVINDKVLDGLFIKYNLDKGKILKEMQSKEINNILEENKALAAKIGVRGVPAYIINGEFVNVMVNYDVLKAKKEAAGQK
jgi:protein-disulfide isomerase